MIPPVERDSVSRGVFYQYLNSITVVFAGFLFYIYIIHFFSAEVVGVVALLLAIASLLNIIFSLGLGNGVQHFISYYLGKNEYGKIAEFIRKFTLISVIIAALSVAFVYFSAPYIETLFFHTQKYLLLIRLLGLDLFAMILNVFLGAMLIGMQNFRAQAVRSITGIIISYLSPAVLFLFTGNLVVIVIGWAIGNATAAVLSAIFLHGRIKNLRELDHGETEMGAVFRYSIPIFISSLIGYGAVYVDRFIVSYFLNLTELGIYNFGLLIVSAIGSLVTPFPSILLPKFSEFFGRGDRDSIRLFSSKAAEILLTLYLSTALLIAAISPSILLFLSSEEYLPATIPIIIILTVNSVFIISNIFVPALQSVRKTGLFILSSGLALLSNFIISVTTIPLLGMVGAAMGFASIYVVSFSVLYYYVKKYDLIEFERMKIAKIYFSGFIMFAIMFIIQHYFGYSIIKLFLYIILGYFIYFLLIKMFRIFNRDDLELIMFLIPRRLQWLKKYLAFLL